MLGTPVRLLVALVVLLAMGAALAGCGASATPTATKAAEPTKSAAAATQAPSSTVVATRPAATPTKAVKTGGILVDAVMVDPTNSTLDPAAGGTGGWAIAFGFCYENLFGRDPKTFEIIPKIGEKYEIAQDGTSATIYLRKGVKWHNLPPVNGREFTSDDVKWNIERQRDASPPFSSTASWKIVKSVDIIDKYTVKLTFTQPYASITWLLTDPNYMYYPRELQEAYGDKQMKAAIGTGPFMLKSYEPKVSVEFVRNPDYYIKGLPILDGYKQVWITDNAARIAAFRSGQIQYMNNNNLSVKDSILQSVTGLQVNDSVGPTNVIWTNSKAKPLDDVRVRRALDLAIDRQELIKVALQGAGEIVGYFNRGTPDAAMTEAELAKLPGYRQPKDADMAEAKKLLAEAGYANGVSLEVWVIPSYLDAQRAAEMLVPQLAKVGIDLKIKAVDLAQLSAGVYGPSVPAGFQMAIHSASTRADLDKSAVYHTKSSGNVNGYGSTELDVLLDKVQAEFDLKKRVELCKQVEAKLMELANSPSLYQYKNYQIAAPELRDWASPSKAPWQWHFEQLKYAWFDK